MIKKKEFWNKKKREKLGDECVRQSIQIIMSIIPSVK